MLGDVKELRYDINKEMKLVYMDDKGVLKVTYDDEAIVDLIKQLTIARRVDVYLENLNIDHDKRLPKALIFDCDSDDNGSQSTKDNEERLVEVPFIHYNPDVDKERQDTRDNLRGYVLVKKTI